MLALVAEHDAEQTLLERDAEEPAGGVSPSASWRPNTCGGPRTMSSAAASADVSTPRATPASPHRQGIGGATGQRSGRASSAV